MVEYLHNAIRADAGKDFTIVAEVFGESGDCKVIISDENGNTIYSTKATHGEGEVEYFVIPAQATKGLKGRYFYQVEDSYGSLSFRQPIYLLEGGK